MRKSIEGKEERHISNIINYVKYSAYISDFHQKTRNDFILDHETEAFPRFASKMKSTTKNHSKPKEIKKICRSCAVLVFQRRNMVCWLALESSQPSSAPDLLVSDGHSPPSLVMIEISFERIQAKYPPDFDKSTSEMKQRQRRMFLSIFPSRYNISSKRRMSTKRTIRCRIPNTKWGVSLQMPWGIAKLSLICRAIVPTLELEQLFMEKEHISNEIKENLAKKMQDYGYSIIDTLITDIDPEANVKAAMNRISEARRLREAAEYEADTSKLVKSKFSENFQKKSFDSSSKILGIFSI